MFEVLFNWLSSIYSIILAHVVSTNSINAIICIIIFFSIGVYAQLIRTFAAVMYSSSAGSNVAWFIDSKLTFIGVITHELSHAFFAFITGCKIYRIKLFSFSATDGTLGSVDFSPRGSFIGMKAQCFFVSVAPLVTGSAISLLINNRIMNLLLLENPFSNLKLWFFVILLLQITYHMTLSKEDISNGSIGALFILPIIYLLISFINIPIDSVILSTKSIFMMISINGLISVFICIVLMLMNLFLKCLSKA